MYYILLCPLSNPQILSMLAKEMVNIFAIYSLVEPSRDVIVWSLLDQMPYLIFHVKNTVVAISKGKYTKQIVHTAILHAN